MGGRVELDRCWSDRMSIRAEISRKTWASHLPPFKVIETDMDPSGTYDFLLVFHSNHAPVSYRFRQMAIQSKNAHLSYPVYLTAPQTFVMRVELKKE